MLNYLKINWRYITNLVLFLIAFLFLFYLLKFSFIYAAPIYFALLFYALYRPLIKFLNKRGFSYKISVSISIITITLLLLSLFASIGTLLFFEAQNISKNLPEWITWSQETLEEYIKAIKSQLNQVPHAVTDNAKSQISSASGKITGWIYGVVTAFFSNVSLISKLFVELLLGYILSIFLAFDWQRLSTFLSKNVPAHFKDFTVSVFGDTLKGLKTFIKAQLILITFTFIIVWVVLAIIGVDNSLFLAFISGIFDILPLLGVSTLFIPWIIYLFTIGKIALAVKLTILWLVIVSFRHVMEPKITGNSLGISPFLMLSGMVISSLIFGIIGIILAPIFLVIIKSLWEKGYFSLWLCNNKTKIGQQQR